MKYYLAFDKGVAFKNRERFIKIDLEAINSKLNQDNNLESLTVFTTSFETEKQLKEFLQKKTIVDSRFLSNHLVIIYIRDYIHLREIPYKENALYLNYRNLEELIYKNAKHKGLLNSLIQNYQNYPHLSKEIYSLRVYLSNPYADYKLYDVIRSFVKKICFKEKKGNLKINYKGLFDLGMLLSKIIDSSKKKEQIVEPATPIDQEYDEDDPRYFHLEELKYRQEKEQDDQFRLF